MKSSFSKTMGLLLSFAVIQAHASPNDNELRIRCESKRDANACLEVGISDMKASMKGKDKIHKKSAQRELKKACSIQMGRACNKEEIKTIVLAYAANKNRIPANTAGRGAIRAPKLTGQGKKYSSGVASNVPAYEPPPQNEPPQPPMPAEAPVYVPPPPPMPGPGQCMPGDVNCMQGLPPGMPMGQ